MSQIGNIIKKNFKLLSRSKSSALIVIFGPIFITLLVGLAFNTSGLYGINVGVYSESYNELSSSLLNKLEDKEFRIIKTGSSDECIDKLKRGDLHLCLILPKDFSVEKQNEIVFYVDYSKINLAYVILDIISEKVSERASELSLELTQDLLDTIKETQDQLVSNKGVIVSLIANNQKLGGDVDLTLDQISLLEFEFNKSNFKIEEIKEEISTLNGSAQLSSLIENLESELDKVENEILESDVAKGSAVEKLDSVKGGLTSELNSLNNFKDVVETVEKRIEGIKVKEASNIVNPIVTKIEPVSKMKNLDYILPTLLVLIVMFVGIMLSSTMVMTEKSSRAYFRNYISPTKDSVFIFGAFLSSMIILILQLVIFLGVLIFFLKMQILLNIFNITLLLLIICSLFVLLGMLIGYLFNTEETAIIASVVVGSVLLFFSNTILPIESMPTVFMNVAKYNPFVIAQNALKELMLFQANLDIISMDIYLLLGFGVLFFVLVIGVERIVKQRVS